MKIIAGIEAPPPTQRWRRRCGRRYWCKGKGVKVALIERYEHLLKLYFLNENQSGIENFYAGVCAGFEEVLRAGAMGEEEIEQIQKRVWEAVADEEASG